MSLPSLARMSPQGLGIVCAVGATTLGAAYLASAGAPARYYFINLAALVIGLIALLALKKAAAVLHRAAGAAMLISAIALLATSLFGATVDGASRWLAVGPLSVQPSLILLPLMVVRFLQNRSFVTSSAMLVAALAMAMQPDRAMAGVLVAGLAVQAVLRFDRYAMAAFIGSVLAFAITLIRPDSLPGMPYVEQVYYSSFDVSLLAGLAVVAGTLLLLAPTLANMRLTPEHRDPCLVFGSVWLAVVIAAALGNYPTPVVGYSGAAVLGYVLSLLPLPSNRIR